MYCLIQAVKNNGGSVLQLDLEPVEMFGLEMRAVVAYRHELRQSVREQISEHPMRFDH